MSPEERLEDRVRDALQDEADHIEVDLHRVRGLTEQKLAAPRRRRSWPVLTAAAAVALVAVGVAVLGRSGGPAPTRPPVAHGPHAPKAGGVDTRFGCTNRSTVRFDPVARHLSFVPSLEHGPRWFAAQVAAPRFAFQVNGDTATLRLGNADGSLGSVSTFTRNAGRWDVVRATKCVNGFGLADDPGRVGVLTSNPPFAEHRAREVAGGCGTPTFAGGHGYYDVAGLLRHEWTYAVKCPGRPVKLTMVTASGSTAVPLAAPPTPRPVDVSQLLGASEVPGGPVLLGLWALNDPQGTVAGLSAELRDGRSLPADAVDLPAHQGRLFLLLAPRDQVSQLTVRPAHGSPVQYSSANPPGYRQ